MITRTRFMLRPSSPNNAPKSSPLRMRETAEVIRDVDS